VSDNAPPTGTARLFPHYEGGVPVAEGVRDFLIERLLEDGDGFDLQWLTTVATHEELSRWVRDRGGRQLSQRSLAFWSLVLGTEPGLIAGRALWAR
jgi:hypothetical protein